jgi:hypothetical protein
LQASPCGKLWQTGWEEASDDERATVDQTARCAGGLSAYDDAEEPADPLAVPGVHLTDIKPVYEVFGTMARSGTFDVSEIAKLIPRRCEVEELFDDTTRALGT